MTATSACAAEAAIPEDMKTVYDLCKINERSHEFFDLRLGEIYVLILKKSKMGKL